MNVRGFARVGAVLGLSVLSASGVLMIAAQPGAGGERQGQPAGQPAGQPGGGQPGGPGGRGGRGGGEFTNVEQAMKSMGGAMRQLKDSIGDASKKDANLTAIARIQTAAVYAKNNKPVHLKGGDASVEGYRKTMIEFMRSLLDLESQVLEGKTKEAEATYAKIGEMKDLGHDKFIQEEGPKR